MDEALPVMLKSLRLPTFADHHAEFAKTATDNAWSYERYLSKLCEQEMARRYEARIAKWSREARLPPGKSFENLSMEPLPKLVQKQVIALRDSSQCALQADNVLLIGPSGVGKSHIAAALAQQLIEQGVRARWMSATALVQHLQQSRQELDLMSAMTRFDKYRVMIILVMYEKLMQKHKYCSSLSHTDTRVEA